MLNQIHRNTRRSRIQSASVLAIFCTVAVFSAMLTPVSADAEDEITIVSVDMQEIFEAHPASADARTKIQEEVAAKRQELEAMEEGDRRAAQQRMQQDLQQKNQELQQEALEKVQADIQEVAAEKGYDYVVDANMLLAGGKDVTKEVIKALDL